MIYTITYHRRYIAVRFVDIVGIPMFMISFGFSFSFILLFRIS